MTGDHPVHVVIAAGGLGTRVRPWSRYLPKEFFPVDGRPGIVHILDEVAEVGPARIVIVYHPYYEAFAAWARQVLSPHGRARYLRAAALPIGEAEDSSDVELIPQNGSYADITSVLNAADHFALDPAEPLYVAFSDNLYPAANPTRALRAEPGADLVVYAHPYRADLAGSRGVVIAERDGPRLVMTGLVEKPDSTHAQLLELRHGPANLFLLEGRMRLTGDFIEFARNYRTPMNTEPKLALAIGAYAENHPVALVPASGVVADLGLPCRPGIGIVRRSA